MSRYRAPREASRRFVVAALAALLVAASPAAAQKPPREDLKPTAITVEAQPLDGFDVRDPGLRRFGALQYRGGLVLSSRYQLFGGFSALRLDPRGEKFLAVSDKGYWLEGRIVYRGGVPSAVADARMMPLLGADGRPLLERGWWDTESLAHDDPDGSGGILYVGIERVHQIVRFDYGKDGLMARGTAIDTPAAMRKLPKNKGIEALVFVPREKANGAATKQPLAGTLIAFSERGLDRAGNLVAFLIGGATPGQFTVKRDHDFDISDAVLLPGGDVLVLERKFSLLSGLHVRIRRVALAAIRPGAVVDGPVIFQADLAQQIDNFEGLAVHRDAAGELVLTLISDDNYSMLQRTLLLQFTLVGE